MKKFNTMTHREILIAAYAFYKDACHEYAKEAKIEPCKEVREKLDAEKKRCWDIMEELSQYLWKKTNKEVKQ